MDDWIYFLFLLGSAALGALTGIWGQTIKERYMRAKLNASIIIDEGYQIVLTVYNEGNNSTRDLSIRVAHIYESDEIVVRKVFYRNYDKEEIAPKSRDEYPIGRFRLHGKIYLQDNVNHITIPPKEYEQPILLIVSISAQDVKNKNYEVTIIDNRLTYAEINNVLTGSLKRRFRR